MCFSKTANEFLRDKSLDGNLKPPSESIGTFAFLSDIEREGAEKVRSKLGQVGWELAIAQAERLGVFWIRADAAGS